VFCGESVFGARHVFAPTKDNGELAMAEGSRGVSGIIGLIVVIGVLNLLSWIFDWGWYFY
jgi:hypothetical protein